MARIRRSPFMLLVWVLLILLIAGFWCHSCMQADIAGRYSASYFVGLCTATVGLVSLGLLVGFLTRPASDVAQRERFRRIRKVIVVLLLAGILLAEFSLSMVQRSRLHDELADRRENLAQWHPFLQTVPPANNDELHTNRWGFRGDPIDPEKAEGTFRVFVLGGSTVYCSRTAYEQTHVLKLHRHLSNALPGINVEVQNAGCDWHTSLHSIIKYQSLIQDFEPDLVIIYHGINDLCRSFSPPEYATSAFRPDYAHFSGPMSGVVHNYFQQELRPPSELYGLVSTAFQDYWFSDFRVAPNEQKQKEWLRWNPGEFRIEPDELPSLRVFRRNLTDLITLIQSRGTQVMVASQPHLLKERMPQEEAVKLIFPIYFCRNASERISVNSLRLALDAFNEASRSVAGECGAGFAELEPAVPKNLEHFIDDVHYTDLGNTVVAQTLYDELVRHQLLPMEDRQP